MSFANGPQPSSQQPQDQQVQELTSKPEVTNPKNLAAVDPQESLQQRQDIKAAKMGTRLRRWALLGLILTTLIYSLYQLLGSF